MFKFALNNYRGFIDEEFSFSSVNILIGENSSGKSSIIKFFLALKQTLERPSRNTNLSIIGDYVNLGYYKDIINGHDENKEISFSFFFNRDYNPYFLKEMVGSGPIKSRDDDFRYFPEDYEHLTSSPQFARFSLKSIYSSESSESEVKFTFDKNLSNQQGLKIEMHAPLIGKLLIVFKKNYSEVLSQAPQCDITFHDAQDNATHKLKDIEFSKEGFLSMVFPYSLKDGIKLLGYGASKSASIYWKIAYLLVLQNYMKTFIMRIKFINPILFDVKRFYIDDTGVEASSYGSLTGMLEVISKRKISKIRLSQFQDLIREFGIADEVKIISAKNMPVKQIKVKINGVWSNIMDVGYGVALQLPIIFYCFLAEFENKQGSLIFIEQPEIHLHPRLHAKFIEVLLKIGKRNSYFIETHSEHIIRKLQLLVKSKEGNINSDNVTISYMKRMADCNSKTVHTIDAEGTLIPTLPSGFFDTSYSLVKELYS